MEFYLNSEYVYAYVSGLKCTVSLHNEDGISLNGYYSQVVTQISTFEVQMLDQLWQNGCMFSAVSTN